MLEEELKKLQKSLSRKVKFSKIEYKQKAKISRLHEYIKIAKGFLHKLSKKVVWRIQCCGCWEFEYERDEPVIKFWEKCRRQWVGMFWGCWVQVDVLGETIFEDR